MFDKFDIFVSGIIIISFAISSVLSIAFMSQSTFVHTEQDTKIKNIVLMLLYFSMTYALESLTEESLGIILLSNAPFMALCRFKNKSAIRIGLLLRPFLVIIYYLLANIYISVNDVWYIFITTYIGLSFLWFFLRGQHISVKQQILISFYVGSLEVFKQSLWYQYSYKVLLVLGIVNIFAYFIVGVIVDYLYNLMITDKEIVDHEIHVDDLTSLHNFKALKKDINKSFNSDDYILAVIDLDSFKKVNDLFGHEKGNHVLQLTAKIISEHLETKYQFMDFKVYRFGGDEIVVSVKVGEDENLREFSLEVTSILEEADNELADKTNNFIGSPVHLSGGMTAFSLCNYDNKETFRKGDTLLYEAKKQKQHGVVMKRDPLLSD